MIVALKGPKSARKSLLETEKNERGITFSDVIHSVVFGISEPS